MARLAVGEHQRVLVVGMLEEIIDAVFLHQPADEIEIRLAILHAIFERRRRAGGRVAEVGEAAVGEDLLDDVDRRLLREDLAVRGPRQQPEPGPQHELVEIEVLLRSGPARLGHHAVEVALLVVLRHERDGRAEPSAEAKSRPPCSADRLDAELEQLAQALDRAELRQGESVFAERRRQLALSLVLGKCVGHSAPRLKLFVQKFIIVQFTAASMELRCPGVGLARAASRAHHALQPGSFGVAVSRDASASSASRYCRFRGARGIALAAFPPPWAVQIPKPPLCPGSLLYFGVTSSFLPRKRSASGLISWLQGVGKDLVKLFARGIANPGFVPNKLTAITPYYCKR